MAQFRTTADILDLALTNAGEVTNGNSPYETQILNYLNRVHFTIIAGGTIPIGKDTTVQIDEVWSWSKAKSPLILELQPAYETGTITLTQGSEAGVFSSAPSSSLRGWHIKVDGRDEWFRIAAHTAASVDFELDAAYTDESGSGLGFTAAKLDYDLVPDYIIVNDGNNKIEFQEVAGTTITGTLTSGTYTPADLISHVATTMNTAGGTPTYTGSYSTTTRKFTLSSDRAGGAVFVLVGTGSNSGFSIHKTLGFDDENTTNAASVTSTYVLGGMCRLIEPFRMHRAGPKEGSIFGLDSESFHRNYPLCNVQEGLPEKFCVLRESGDGTFTVRFSAYPKNKTRIEIEHVAVPRDLKDAATSIPLLPRKYVDVLEDAATFYLMLNKSDDRAQVYANLMQGKLNAMIAQHRGSLLRTGKNFGQIVPRKEYTNAGRKLRYGEKD